MREENLVDPSGWVEWPPTYDPKLHYLIDQVVPRKELGRGVSETETSISHDAKAKYHPQSVSDSTPHDKSSSHKSTQPSEERNPPAPPKQRVLAQRFSEEAQPDEIEIIAISCKKAFAEKILYSEDLVFL